MRGVQGVHVPPTPLSVHDKLIAYANISLKLKISKYVL